MRIGLLGGTFDPPHLAHLHTGEVAYRQLDLDVVLFMPAGSPWQKVGRGVSGPGHRWEMTRRAAEGVEYFKADEREVHRQGWTYTADTLSTFDPADEIVLILGADAACGLPTWDRADEVMNRTTLAVAPRAGTSRERVASAVSGEYVWLDMVELDISGTLIRERLMAGRSARFLVRDGVWRYMTDHQLYVSQARPPVQ
ncbi:MAG: nicotinate-nucleotide adenylyltransferase [Acidimicrobiia bacterium]